MIRKRLDANIPADLHAALNDQAREQNRTVTNVAIGYLRAGIARDKGEVIEQQSLPVLREIVQSELAKAIAQLQAGLREEFGRQLREVQSELKRLNAQNTSRLAALQVKSLREAGVARRLVTMLAETSVSTTFSQEALERARAETGRDLATALQQSES
jgi:hypothetical protein